MALTPYAGAEHQPFIFRPEAADDRQVAVLLVHGFPGTPAEMRPLGQRLQTAGITAQGILLPGFGPQIPDLARYTWQDWVAATTEALTHLQREYSRTLLIGFSMGGAVALNAASAQSVDGLILLAPFTQLGGDLIQLAWPALRLIFREFQPFKKVDFADPEVRRNIANFLPQADLDDPESQAELRQMRIPASVMDQLRQMGRQARRAAPRVRVPVLCIQGALDQVVQPARTRKLVTRLPNLVQYAEVAGGHQIIDPSGPACAESTELILAYIEERR